MLRKLYGSLNKQMLMLGLFTAVFLNFHFILGLAENFPLPRHLFDLLSVILVHTALLSLIINFIAVPGLGRYFISAFFLTASLAAYFADTLGIIVSSEMIHNVFQTDIFEAFGTLTPKMLIYVLLFGVLPSAHIFYRVEIPYSLKSYFKPLIAGFLVYVLVIFLNIFALSSFYSSFFREHKDLRMSANPSFPIYSAATYLKHRYIHGTEMPFQEIGKGSKISTLDTERELVILVVGETARAMNFSLNGYPRKTNPRLEKEDVISFTHVHSCGTSTAVSVPCMFSVYKEDEYDEYKALRTENLVDILRDTGDVQVLWRDNNSSSKGVADRIAYEDFKTPEHNPVCNPECRDIGMLSGLREYINGISKKDIFIVLHQMGSHGPAYYQRYPIGFEEFKPACRTNELEDCSKEQVQNAYDNTIYYTDYFLSEVIRLLKEYDDRFETSMIYVSDHGESLGEKGVYLHGLPKMIAPDEQLKVPFIVWMGKKTRQFYDADRLLKSKEAQLSHDNVFHSILRLFEVQTTYYKSDKDIFSL